MKTLYMGIMRDFDQEKRDYQRRIDAVRWASDCHRRQEIERTISRHELEPDEFLTAEQKAQAILGRATR